MKSIARFGRLGVSISGNPEILPPFPSSVENNAYQNIIETMFFNVSNVVDGTSYVATISVGAATVSMTKYDAVTYQGVPA